MSSADSQTNGHIAVVGQWREGQGRMPAAYVAAVAASGGRPRVLSTFDLRGSDLPPHVEVEDALDPADSSALDGSTGLLVPGGGDVDPAWYGQNRHPETHHVNHRRDLFERTLLAEALRRDMPVLAICHGMQMLNVLLGGALDQHLIDRRGRMNHDVGKPTHEPVHGIRVEADSNLARILGDPSVRVNSHHHQGLAGAAVPLQECAWAEDGVLEAVESTDHSWVIGVQWHPEVMAARHMAQKRLFDSFVEATRAYARRGAAAITAATA